MENAKREGGWGGVGGGDAVVEGREGGREGAVGVPSDSDEGGRNSS